MKILTKNNTQNETKICKFYSLRKQLTICDATAGFPAKSDVWGNKHRNSKLMVPLVGGVAREVCFNQSEALPRSG